MTNSNLTDDERSVLMIAALGQSMMPIARWKQPVENLAMLGLLKKLDSFNYVITDNGRAILADSNREEDEAFRGVMLRLIEDRNAQQQTVLSGNQAAQHLAMAAKAAAKISGLTPQQEAWTLGQGIVARALELLNSDSPS